MNLPAVPTTDFRLTLTAKAFTPPQRPNFEETLRVNNKQFVSWRVTDPEIEEQVRLPRDLVRSGLLKIEFLNSDPRSPAEIGLSTDVRKLGLAVETLKLEPVDSQPHF
ncbi:MAG: hypothetical protein WAM39_19780 [Bryobacteraceae bacterium]